MFTPTNLIRVALLLTSIALCVLYFYAPIFWTHGNWYDPWLGFDASVGRELLLVCAMPGFVASIFLYFSELAWKRILSLSAQGALNLCWLWNLVESWIDGRTLIQNGAWAEGGHGWDYLTCAGALVCWGGGGWVIRADYRSSRWKTNGYGFKPLPGAKPKKDGRRYNA
ncbi:MAG TPA: hypothetical protein VL860_03795, partial [Planctomycetota bacterium]|nr:hypothetical protein [Planctomycetota bacterium]